LCTSQRRGSWVSSGLVSRAPLRLVGTSQDTGRYLYPHTFHSSSTWVKLAPYFDSLPEVFDLTFEQRYGTPSGNEQ
jgi:hypothetical protein